MNQFNHISVMARSNIVYLREQGLNITEIAEELNLSRPTVRLWVSRFQAEGIVSTKTRRPMPKLIGAEGVAEIKRTYADNPFTPTRFFAERFNCSAQTIRNILHREGIYHRIPAKKVLLTDAHKAARVCFAREYRDFNWSHAIFSDEKTFTSSQHGRKHLWRVDNTRYEPKNVIPNSNSGRITVNMWGWMSSAGPGELIYLPARATGSTYLELLQDTMLPSVRIVYPAEEMPEIVFVQPSAGLEQHKINVTITIR